MKNLRKIQGITLIALVVTIVLLLILAGISMQLIGGSNGILNRASQALDVSDKATATEKMELKITYLNMVSYGENTRKATLQELADGLFSDKEVEYVKLKNQEVASLEPIDVTGESSFFVKLKEYSYEFEIDENLCLASVDGAKIENKDDTYNELKTEIEELKKEINSSKSEKEVMKEQIKELSQTVSLLQTKSTNKVKLIKKEWQKASIKTNGNLSWITLDTVSLAGNGSGKAIISYSGTSNQNLAKLVQIQVSTNQEFCTRDVCHVAQSRDYLDTSCSTVIEYSENTVLYFGFNTDTIYNPWYTYSVLLIPNEE